MLKIIFFRGTRKSVTGSYSRKIDILVVIKFQDQKKKRAYTIERKKVVVAFCLRTPKEKHAVLTIFLDFAVSLPQHSHAFLVNSG